jgi:hypothetical protein
MSLPVGAPIHHGEVPHATGSLTAEDFGAESADVGPALEDYELEELYSGRFPANYGGELIHLRHLPPAEFRRILDAFDQNKDVLVMTSFIFYIY